MKEKLTIATAEPFFFPGGKSGCVLIHGLTGTPKEMRLMGEALQRKGYSALGIRLAGHATQPEDLLRTRWRDWMVSVEDGIHLLKNHCDHIFYIGLSLGGILALTTAVKIKPAGVIAISTPFSVDPRTRYARLLSPLIPWIKKKPDQASAYQSPHVHVDYPDYPTRSLAELYNLMQTMQATLKDLRCPVLLINSRLDPIAPPSHTEQFKQGLVSCQVKQIILEKSGHVIPESEEREIAFDAIDQFMQNNSAK